MNGATLIQVEGRKIALTDLSKVVYPETGTTKWDVIDYYTRMAPAIVPHLRGKPVALLRHLEGASEPPLVEMRPPEERPVWIRSCMLAEGTSEMIREYCMVDDVSSLLWLVNLGVIEIQTLQTPCVRPEHPSMLLFRLEPWAPASFYECIEAARLLREVLAAIDLTSHVKTDGLGGLHVCAPLDGTARVEDAAMFAHAVAILLHREHPALVTTTQRRDVREGRVLIDWTPNGHRVACVAPYSLRAGAVPRVATPLAWEELDAVRTRNDQRPFELAPEAVIGRIAALGDVLEGIEHRGQPLPRI